MKFLDEAKILIGSGKGGNGCVGFHREKYIEFGGPDGGNGGKGGSLYFEAVNDLNTLIDFRYTQHFRAKPGQGGMGRNKSGAKGEDLVVKVPVGTEIIDDDGETVLMDMMEPEKTILFLKGGDGGFGNAHYKSATNQAPRNSTPGWEGEERLVWLRLKLIADVGLVGMPNAGKSTFLSVVSAAKPKVADYPFTTLHPNLGVVRAGDKEMVIADIPGLIEGASDGLGLGHKFLAHVERTSALLHLIDITQDDPAGAYRTIRAELEKYGDIISDRPEIVALTKSDALGDELSADQARVFEEETGIKPFVFSCLSGEGVKPVLFALHDEVYKKETNESFVLNLHKN